MACKCVCCPYGPMIALPITFGFFALWFSWAFAFGCSLFESDIIGQKIRGYGPWTVQGASFEGASWTFDDDYLNYTTPSNANNVTLYFDSVCYAWADASTLFDAPMNTARAFSIISATISLWLFIMVLFPACCSFGTSKAIFSCLGCTSIFLGVCCLLTLIGLASELCTNAAYCGLGWSGALCITAGILWMLIGCCIIAMPKELTDEYAGSRQQPVVAQEAGMVAATTGVEADKVVTRTENPDGSVTVATTTTTTNPDGSKTVTEQTDIEAAH